MNHVLPVLRSFLDVLVFRPSCSLGNELSKWLVIKQMQSCRKLDWFVKSFNSMIAGRNIADCQPAPTGQDYQKIPTSGENNWLRL